MLLLVLLEQVLVVLVLVADGCSWCWHCYHSIGKGQSRLGTSPFGLKLLPSCMMPFLCKLSRFFRRDEIDECEAGIASASMNGLQLQTHKCGQKYSRKSRWLESGGCQEYPENRSALVASQDLKAQFEGYLACKSCSYL